MKNKLILAAVLLAASIAALLYLTAQAPEAVETIATEPARQLMILETTEAATMPETTNATEPAADDTVLALLGKMTLEEKVGQIFLARCPGQSGAEAVQDYHLGGFLLFGQDFDGKTPDSLRQTLSDYQEAANIRLLIAVDEEGGTVCRVSDHAAFRSTKFESPRTLYRQGGMEQVLATEREKAQLLCSLGINVNMAPVCDITDRSGAFMYQRSLGESPEITGEYVTQTIRIMADAGVGAVMKHFPGYGNNSDTHTGIATDRRSLQELESRDLLPFFAGVDAGGSAILVSHTVVEGMDPAAPASLSETVHTYLRQAMNFRGVIITDDLSMNAIAKRYGAGEAAVLAVLAGNDLLCSTEYAVQYPAVLQACREGRIPMKTLNTAVEHILRWKQSLNLLPVG